MTKRIVLSFLIGFLINLLTAQDVYNPPVYLTNAPEVEVHSISTLGYTRVSFWFIPREDGEFWIDPDIYICDYKNQNRKFKLLSLATQECRALGKHNSVKYYKGKREKFALYFEAVPSDINIIDIREPNDNGWKWIGVISNFKMLKKIENDYKTIYIRNKSRYKFTFTSLNAFGGNGAHWTMDQGNQEYKIETLFDSRKYEHGFSTNFCFVNTEKAAKSHLRYLPIYDTKREGYQLRIPYLNNGDLFYINEKGKIFYYPESVDENSWVSSNSRSKNTSLLAIGALIYGTFKTIHSILPDEKPSSNSNNSYSTERSNYYENSTNEAKYSFEMTYHSGDSYFYSVYKNGSLFGEHHLDVEWLNDSSMYSIGSAFGGQKSLDKSNSFFGFYNPGMGGSTYLYNNYKQTCTKRKENIGNAILHLLNSHYNGCQ